MNTARKPIYRLRDLLKQGKAVGALCVPERQYARLHGGGGVNRAIAIAFAGLLLLSACAHEQSEKPAVSHGKNRSFYRCELSRSIVVWFEPETGAAAYGARRQDADSGNCFRQHPGPGTVTGSCRSGPKVLTQWSSRAERSLWAAVKKS